MTPYNFFNGRTSINVEALCLGQRLNTKVLEHSRLSAAPYVIQRGVHGGMAVLFRYGVIVLFGLADDERTDLLEDLREHVTEPAKKIEDEDVEIRLIADKNDGVDPSYIHFKEWDLERIQLVAETLAKCVILSYYESRMADIFDRIEPIAQTLQKGRVSGRKARNILKHIGTTLSIQRKMVGHVEVEEKPELLWDRPDLERLFMRLEDEYELNERHKSLEKKLDLVYRTAETMMGLLDAKRTLHVEWYITLLIVFDILLTLGEKYGIL